MDECHYSLKFLLYSCTVCNIFFIILFGYSYVAFNQLIAVAKRYLDIKIDLTGRRDYDKL